MTDTFDQYGYTFQVKLISTLFKDRAFLHQVYDILSPKYFDSDANAWIIETVMNYWNEYRNSPTLEVLKVETEKIAVPALKADVIERLKDAVKHFESTDLEYVKAQALDFCKNQVMKNAILESVDLLKAGQFDNIKAKIDYALKAGTDKNIGHIYSSDLEERYSQYARNVISTGWPVIDSLINGGLGKGELGTVVAPAGIGKSWVLVCLAANALKQGKNVIYYTMELNPFYVGMRFDAHFTNTPFQDLSKEAVKTKFPEIQDSARGNLVIKFFPANTPSVTTLSAHIEKCIMQNFKPDLIVVDYADLLRSTSNKDGEQQAHEIYLELRGLAHEYEIPIWTASQTNRGGLKEDVIEGDSVAASYRKIAHSDFIISLSRKLEDKLTGTGRIHVIKNRFGADGITFPSKVDTSTGRIDLFDPSSPDGQIINTSQKNPEEVMRNTLSKKLLELDSK
jgi:hypothetical protein